MISAENMLKCRPLLLGTRTGSVGRAGRSQPAAVGKELLRRDTGINKGREHVGLRTRRPISELLSFPPLICAWKSNFPPPKTLSCHSRKCEHPVRLSPTLLITHKKGSSAHTPASKTSPLSSMVPRIRKL